MEYRNDPSLNFLGNLSSEELNDLVYILTHDKDGSVRLTETLTSNVKYKHYYPDHHMYWEDIAAELQLFGGNTIVNLLRLGKGVYYKEILCDVCDKIKVNYNKNSSVEKIEENLLMKILQDSLEKMSPEEIINLGKELGVENLEGLNSQAMVAIFQAIFKMGGFKSYQLTVVIVNAVLKALIGRGLSIGGNAALMQIMSILTGPIGWTLTILWSVSDIAGAAYRVTIPAVVQIAYLRKLAENRENIEVKSNETTNAVVSLSLRPKWL